MNQDGNSFLQILQSELVKIFENHPELEEGEINYWVNSTSDISKPLHSDLVNTFNNLTLKNKEKDLQELLIVIDDHGFDAIMMAEEIYEIIKNTNFISQLHEKNIDLIKKLKIFDSDSGNIENFLMNIVPDIMMDYIHNYQDGAID